jgi:hypothetical protein
MVQQNKSKYNINILEKIHIEHKERGCFTHTCHDFGFPSRERCRTYPVEKVNDVIRRKCKDGELDSLPSIEEIMNCKLENDPPVEILSALLGMCKKSCNLFI